MKWKEEYSVGIHEIDAQHKLLVDCISRLRESVNKKEKGLAVHFTLVQLADFARIHFATEESLMRIHQYPELEEHIQEHHQFIAELHALQEKALTADVSREMAEFLVTWLAGHIMTTDKRYASFLPRAGVVFMSAQTGKGPSPRPRRDKSGAR